MIARKFSTTLTICFLRFGFAFERFLVEKKVLTPWTNLDQLDQQSLLILLERQEPRIGKLESRKWSQQNSLQLLLFVFCDSALLKKIFDTMNRPGPATNLDQLPTWTNHQLDQQSLLIFFSLVPSSDQLAVNYENDQNKILYNF